MSEQDVTPISFGDPATEPVDLAQAFKMLNQNDGEAAAEPVEQAEPSEPNVPGNEPGGSEGVGEQGTAAPADQSAPVGHDGSATAGGSSDGIQAIDFDSRRQDILRGIQQQALNDVRREFKNNGIEYCTIESLYQRDDNTGRVTFKNPDDPRNPFNSRAEAQAWVEAFNKQIDTRFRQEVNKKQQELVGTSAPTLRLISFAPKYQAMSQAEKEIMDDLIDGYGVRDRQGRIVGYNVDLDAVAAQAKRIAKRMKPAEPAAQPAQQQQASGPAMDMPTGAGTSNDAKEPKTIGEALKMFDEQQRLKSKKGKK
jgi:hypothetical protein